MPPSAPPEPTLRDWFLPALLRAPDEGLEGRALRWGQRRRTRRFISLVLVLVGASSASAIALSAQGLWRSGSVAASFVLVLVGVLLLVRRGSSIERLGAAFLSVLSLLTACLSVLSGPHGAIALFWIALAPTVALSVAGPRVAGAVFAFDSVLVAAAIWVMYQGLVPVRIDVSHEPGAHIVSMLGAMSAYYALSRAYERENDESIAELERNNAALSEARKVAEDASRAKGAFLAAMSHEIRTPMNGVLGMTSVMLSTEVPPAVRDGLLVIKQSGDTLMGLLNDLLDLSRIEAGRLEIEQCPVEVAAEMRTVTTLLAPFALERGDRMEVRVDGAVPRYVLGDPLRVRQVLLNLVSNGLKFTRGGEVVISARVEGERLRIEVRDTGIGIAPEALATLFNPFKQADASTTRRFGGSGLGLAIVRQLVDAMGGQVAVESVVGEGSTFSVFLPMRACDAPKAATREVTEVAGRPLRVLLAEDNAINQKVATLLLERLGHSVRVVENGVVALEALAGERFDLVLMDCHMPEMDGFDATRAMRDRGDETPVVALTAASLPEERARCFASGMVDVLLKPINRTDLARVLARFGGAPVDGQVRRRES